MNSSSRLSLNYTLILVFCITLTVVMGVSSIMPILPELTREFAIPPSAIGFIFMAFTIPGVLLTPLGGLLADRIGRKQVLVPSFFIFAVGGTACAFATSFEQLLFFRFIQGVGVAPLSMLYTTLIGDLYEGHQRMQAMGYNAAVLSLGTAIYPALGGLLGEFGWRIPFLLPLLTLPLIIAFIRLPLPKYQNAKPMREYLSSTKDIILSPSALVLFSLSFLTFLILYGPMVTYFPVLADSRFAASSSTIGIVFSVASAGSMLTAILLGYLSKRLSTATILFISHCCYIISLCLMPLIEHIAWAFIPIFFYGLGQGLNIPTTATLLTDLAPTEGRAAIMAVNGTILRLAQTIAPLLFGVVYMLGGIDITYYAGLLVVLLMTILVARTFYKGH